ncbi:MAG: CysB family HTH-type transcriptional regulator [Casimicrobiaceae bacterium]|nr:CysB family HTH-type transcriptional regulator [Casimicrobiaceae bacterium]MCX8097845.1 CysB family HTH-type transcriptional regulator [Casimicrobiaceae bacterium]MDW8311365.1 CysB family HTH-type transcriptional regulator [Burkholderiales bacterium]
MNLQSIKLFCAVVEHGFSVSAAAKAQHTTQPVVSKHIRALEGELGLPLFERRGKRFVGLTPAGREAFAIARRVHADTLSLKALASELANARSGVLTIATTHTQARYVLPRVITQFSARYPEVRLKLRQGNPKQCADAVASCEADLAIATEALSLDPLLVTLPCYRWNRVVIAPRRHPIGKRGPLTIEELARYPLITYDTAFTGRSQIDRAFAQAGLTPNVALTALDSDVIKTYVRLNMGVGILAEMAYDPKTDADLKRIDASHLFAPSVTRVGLRRNAFLRRYVYDFILMFAPSLRRSAIEAAVHGQ